jgi:hypothetical protein
MVKDKDAAHDEIGKELWPHVKETMEDIEKALESRPDLWPKKTEKAKEQTTKE